MSFVVVFGGGVMQIPVVEIVKGMGHDVVLVDSRRGCPVEKAFPELADASRRVYQLPSNTQAVLRDLGALDLDIVATVAAGSDCPVTKAAVDALIDRSTVDPWQAWRCSNKLLMREVLQASGWGQRQPTFWRHMRTEMEAAHWIDIAPLRPLIVKPLNSSGSRGVRIIREPKDVPAAIRSAVGGVLLEQFIEGGEEYSFDVLHQEGEVQAWSHCRRIFSYDDVPMELGHVSQRDGAADVSEALATLAHEIFDQREGIIKADLMVPPGKRLWDFIVLELTMRLSGGFDSMWTARKTQGVSVIEQAIELQVEGSLAPEREAEAPFAACAAVFPPTQGGTSWRLLDYSEPGMYGDVAVLATRGEVRPLENCAERPAFALATGNTAAEAWEAAQARAAALRFEAT